MAAAFQLDVLAASVPFFRGKCVSVVIPTTDGEYGVLAGHCNAVGAVTAGELQFETEEGEHRRAAVAQGLFKIDGDRVLLLLDAAERPEDIDVNRALRARQEAEEALRQKRSMAEYLSDSKIRSRNDSESSPSITTRLAYLSSTC